MSLTLSILSLFSWGFSSIVRTVTLQIVGSFGAIFVALSTLLLLFVPKLMDLYSPPLSGNTNYQPRTENVVVSTSSDIAPFKMTKKTDEEIVEELERLYERKRKQMQMDEECIARLLNRLQLHNEITRTGTRSRSDSNSSDPPTRIGNKKFSSTDMLNEIPKEVESNIVCSELPKLGMNLNLELLAVLLILSFKFYIRF